MATKIRLYIILVVVFKEFFTGSAQTIQSSKVLSPITTSRTVVNVSQDSGMRNNTAKWYKKHGERDKAVDRVSLFSLYDSAWHYGTFLTAFIRTACAVPLLPFQDITACFGLEETFKHLPV